MRHQYRVDGGDPGEYGGLSFLDETDEFVGIEPGHHNDRTSGIDGEIEGHGQPEYMEERQDGQKPFFATVEFRKPGAELHHVGENVCMREHGALGDARGATGVLEKSEL